MASSVLALHSARKSRSGRSGATELASQRVWTWTPDVVSHHLRYDLCVGAPQTEGLVNRSQKLLVLSLVAGAATQFRLGPIGIGELAAALYLGTSILRKRTEPETSLLRRTQLLFILLAVCLAFGALWSAFTYEPLSGSLHDALGFSLSFSLVLMALRHDLLRPSDAADVWRAVTLGLTICFGCLLSLGQVVRGIGPIQFWYKGSDRFVGLASNPNQIPVFFSVLPALTLFLFRGWKRWALIGAQVAVGLASRSDGFQLAQVAAVVGGLSAGAIGDLARRKSSPNGLIRAIALALLAIVTIPLWLQLANERSTEALAGGGNGRTFLIKGAIGRILDSPLFGFGPGAGVFDSAGTLFEVHNNYLDLVIRAGLVGVLALVAFQLTLIRDAMRKSPILVGAAMSLVAFGMTGLQLRWPIHWFAWIAIGTLSMRSQKTSGELKPNRNSQSVHLSKVG
jgi:O-antigen ligase